MPNQPKTAVSTYRFDPSTIDLLDRLIPHLTVVQGGRWNRTEVLRLAVRRLAEQEGVEGGGKNSRKK